MTAVTRLHLGRVSLPDSHPRAAARHCDLFSFVVAHGDGLVVVDTGPRSGHPVIDELYSPEVVSIIDALNTAGFDERDVTAVVNTHLHFDHCGQNHLFPSTPIWVSAAEVEAAEAEFYTVPDWAAIAEPQLRLSADNEAVAEGVRLLHTPGHTPGHQSIAVDTPAGREIIVGQTCYTCAEFEAGQPAEFDMHDETWLTAGTESLARLRSLNANRAFFSHDRAIYQRA